MSLRHTLGSSFLDGFAMTGLFGKLRWKDAPITAMAPSPVFTAEPTESKPGRWVALERRELTQRTPTRKQIESEPFWLHLEHGELVRGKDTDLVDRLTSIVRTTSVILDLSEIDRVDASGIAALISLYGAAHAERHEFGVANPSPRVAEILALVGLDRILADWRPSEELRELRSRIEEFRAS